MRGLVVRTHAEHDRAALLEDVVRVAEPGRLLRAPGRFVTGIEVEDDWPAAEVGESHALAVMARELEVRCRTALLDHDADATGCMA